MSLNEEETNATITLRTDIRPGDIGEIVRAHGRLYAAEYGFDATFEAYVASPLAECVIRDTQDERIWIAERVGQPVGFVAVVRADTETAQLRWFLVDPSTRGAGLGRRLLREAVGFAHACGYQRIILWTVSALEAAAHLYRAAGFTKVEQITGRMWGADVVVERYEMMIETSGDAGAATS